MQSPRAAAVAAALALSAAACGGAPSGGTSPPVPPPVAGSPSPKADGPKGDAPKAPASDPVPAMPKPPAPSAIPADTEVKTMPSGLKYSVLKDGGPGPKPRRGDKVKVHYTGWLTDGKEFDSSRTRGEPAEFVIGQVVEGWNQALVEMTVGSRWKLTIPPELGYGDAGAGGVIPPNATLVFDVELLGFRGAPPFKKPDPAAAKTTPSGLKYEVLCQGEGAAPADAEVFELAYTLYDEKGTALQSSELTGHPILGRRAEMQLAFLKEAPTLLKPGQEIMCEVPPDLCWGDRPMGNLPAKSTTFWRLKLVRVVKVPAFAMPPADKLETTATGLKIWIEKPGEGASPAMGNEVVCDYAGWLTDGTPFDDSYSRGTPATFAVGQLIPGWNEALQRLKPGARAWLVVPPDLGYGAHGQGKIPANATLVFLLELREVRK